MTARISLILGKTRGHRPRLQFAQLHVSPFFVQSRPHGMRTTDASNMRTQKTTAASSLFFIFRLRVYPKPILLYWAGGASFRTGMVKDQ
jgi:hypothetical protein